MSQENLHKGHRKRMKDKADGCSALYDHEILELLLFTAQPRVNTNPAAHALLDRFGTLKGVFSASTEELKTVKGIGDSSASLIRVVGEISRRMGSTEGVAVLKNTEDCKKFISMRFYGKAEEYLEFYHLGKGGKIKRIVSFTSADRNRASTDTRSILNDITEIKPESIVVAHNHPNGCADPSENDDIFTRRLRLICKMSNVTFADHIIFAGRNNFFSYRTSGRLEEVTQNLEI